MRGVSLLGMGCVSGIETSLVDVCMVLVDMGVGSDVDDVGAIGWPSLALFVALRNEATDGLAR
jgi:hypothetical protein